MKVEKYFWSKELISIGANDGQKGECSLSEHHAVRAFFFFFVIDLSEFNTEHAS